MNENDLSETIAVLRKNPVLGTLSDESLTEIALAVQKHRLPAKTIIFRQGDSADNLYIIQSGSARVFKEGEDGPRTDLIKLQAGDCFGELALLTGRPRMRSVETIDDNELLVIDKNDFLRIIQRHPYLSSAFIEHITGLLEKTDMQLEAQASEQYRVQAVSLLDFIFIFFLSLLLGLGYNATNPNGISLMQASYLPERVITVHPSDAVREINGETLFVDARPPNYFEKGHIQSAISIPLPLFDIMYMMELNSLDKSKNIIVYGRTLSSRHDERVAEKLVLRGHRNTRILQGSFSLWQARGYPVTQ